MRNSELGNFLVWFRVADNTLGTLHKSLWIGIDLRRSHDESLVTFKRASTDILRAREGLLSEFGFAEPSIRLVQLIMDVSEMIQLRRFLKPGNRIRELSHAHICRP